MSTRRVLVSIPGDLEFKELGFRAWGFEVYLDLVMHFVLVVALFLGEESL